MVENQAVTYQIPTGMRTDRFTENKGIHITSDADITVHGGNGGPSTSGGFLAIPLADWSREFYVMSYQPQTTHSSQITVVGATDFTTVQIFRSVVGLHFVQ